VKKLILLLFIASVSYGQIRSLNGALQNSQRLTISYDDTASSFRWAVSNGVHTLYIPYNLSPVFDTGGISVLNGLISSTQNFAVDYFRTIIRPEGDTLDKFNNIQPTIFLWPTKN